MRLRVIHRTGYAYGDAVSTSHHEARLAPRDADGQRTLAHEVVVTPTPSVRRERTDYFGNRVSHFSLREPHRSLEVVATSLVELDPLTPPFLSASPPWEVVRDRVASDRRRDVLDAYAYTFDSAQVKTIPA